MSFMMSLTTSWVAPMPGAPPRMWPAGITTIIGTAFFAAINESRMTLARPTDDHASSLSPAPCSR